MVSEHKKIKIKTCPIISPCLAGKGSLSTGAAPQAITCRGFHITASVEKARLPAFVIYLVKRVASGTQGNSQVAGTVQ